MKSSLRTLAYFAAAAEHGSTVAAAKALNISQPAISTAIRELEAVLGQALFRRRTARGLDLTPFGARKLIEARRLLSDFEMFEAGGPVDDGDLRGVLVVACMTTIAPLCLPAILRRFRDRHPHVTVHLREGDLRETRNLVLTGAAELAITYDVGIAGGERETLTLWPSYLLLPPGHRLAGAPSATLADIAGEPLILFGLPDSREFWLTALQQQGLAPLVAYEVLSQEMVRSMVANGHGVAIMAACPAIDQAYDGKPVVRVPLPALAAQKVIALTPAPARLSRLASAFLDGARQYFAADQGDNTNRLND